MDMQAAFPSAPDVLAAACRGEAAAYARLLQEAAARLRVYFSRHRPLGSPLEVEDLVQESLLTVHAKWHTYDPARPFGPWLYTLARHKLIDALRRQRPGVSLDALADILPAPATEDTAAHDVQRLLAELPETQRTALTMARLEGRPLAEVAGHLGKSEGAVKLLLHRGLNTLRRRVGA